MGVSTFYFLRLRKMGVSTFFERPMTWRVRKMGVSTFWEKDGCLDFFRRSQGPTRLALADAFRYAGMIVLIAIFVATTDD